MDGSQLYPWTIFSPAPKTWLLWEAGNNAVKKALGRMNTLAEAQNLPDGQKFFIDLDIVSAIHSSAIDTELQSADVIGGIFPQSISKLFSDVYSYILDWKPGEVKGSGRFDYLLSYILVSGFNFPDASKEQLQYLNNYDLISLIDGRPLISLSGTRVSYYNHGAIKDELVSLLSEINNAMNNDLLKGNRYNALIGDTMVALSPIEFAAYIQKKFVSLHPFHEGVGRTSRYIQDLILGYFGLPYIPGNFGKLQEDVTLPTIDYIKETVASTSAILELLEGCKFKSGDATTWQCRELYKLPAMESKKYNTKVLPVSTLIGLAKNSTNVELVSEFMSSRTTYSGIKKTVLLRDKKKLMLDSSATSELQGFVSGEENLTPALGDSLLSMIKVAASGDISGCSGSSLYGPLLNPFLPEPLKEPELSEYDPDQWLEISDCMCIKDSVGPTEYSEFCYKLDGKGEFRVVDPKIDICYMKKEAYPRFEYDTKKQKLECSYFTEDGEKIATLSKIRNKFKKQMSTKTYMSLGLSCEVRDPRVLFVYNSEQDQCEMSFLNVLNNEEELVFSKDNLIKLPGNSSFPKGVSCDVSRAVRFYTWEGDYLINAMKKVDTKSTFLGIPTTKWMLNLISSSLQEFEAALQEAPKHESQFIFRGIQFDPELDVGDTYTDAQFLSFSEDISTAANFVSDQAEKKFALALKSDATGVDISQFSVRPQQKEVIVDGSKKTFKVVEIIDPGHFSENTSNLILEENEVGMLREKNIHLIVVQ